MQPKETSLVSSQNGRVERTLSFHFTSTQGVREPKRDEKSERLADWLGLDGRSISSNCKALDNGTFFQESEETKMGNNSCLLVFQKSG